LRDRVFRRFIHVDQLAYLRQRQAEALAAQRELQARTVARRIDAAQAAGPDARWRKNPLVLIKPDGTRGDVELARELGDAVAAGAFGCGSAVRCCGNRFACGHETEFRRLSRRIVTLYANVKAASACGHG